jgi:hypothetical protein
MATPGMHVARTGDTIKLEYGIPEIFALKYVTGKNCGDAKFPPFLPRVLFTAIDDRKLFLDAEDGSDLERGMRDLGIGPADFVKVTKIRHPRGGGHSIVVERVDEENDAREPVTETQLERQLTRSIEAQRARNAAPRETRTASASSESNLPAPTITPASAAMCAAMCAAVDAILETQAYATRRGLGVTFSEESVRAIGLSIYIGAQRAGGR